MLKIVSGNKIVLGITEENVARLRLGQPILIKGEDIGLELIKLVVLSNDPYRVIRGMVPRSRRSQESSL